MRKDLDALKLLERGQQSGHLLQAVFGVVEDEPLAAFRQVGDQGLRIDDTCVDKEYMRKAHGSVSKKLRPMHQVSSSCRNGPPMKRMMSDSVRRYWLIVIMRNGKRFTQYRK